MIRIKLQDRNLCFSMLNVSVDMKIGLDLWNRFANCKINNCNKIKPI